MTNAMILDPICDMIVDVAAAREHGLTIEYEREYGFCSAGCQTKFAKNPAAYVPKVEAWLAAAGVHPAAPEGDTHPHRTSGETPNIDAGMRAWYSSCRCCLSDAYPLVVEVLDKERATAGVARAEAGICETAEADETKTT